MKKGQKQQKQNYDCRHVKVIIHVGDGYSRGLVP